MVTPAPRRWQRGAIASVNGQHVQAQNSSSLSSRQGNDRPREAGAHASVLLPFPRLQRAAPPSREYKWVAPPRSSAPCPPNFSIGPHPELRPAVLPLSSSPWLRGSSGRDAGHLGGSAGFDCVIAALAQRVPGVWGLGAATGFAAWAGGAE